MNILKLLKRVACSHFCWHEVSAFEMGSLSRGIIECDACGKRKFIEQLKETEVVCAPQHHLYAFLTITMEEDPMEK